MTVLLTAVVVLVGLVGLSAALVGLAEFSGRLHQRELARGLVVSLEEMLMAGAERRH